MEDHIAGRTERVNVEDRVKRKSARSAGTQLWSHHWEGVRRQAAGRRRNHDHVTETHVAFEALEKALADLRRAYDAQKEFLDCVRHEIRTPMITVKGYADMLLKVSEGFDGRANAVSQEGPDQFRLPAARGKRDARDARLKSGKVDVAYEIFPPMRLVSKLVSTLTPLARQKGLKLRFMTVVAAVRGLRTPPSSP